MFYNFKKKNSLPLSIENLFLLPRAQRPLIRIIKLLQKGLLSILLVKDSGIYSC